MRRVETALGVGAALGLLGLVALAMREPVPPDIHVRVEGARTHILLRDPDSQIQLLPRDLRSRIKPANPPGESSTELLTYKVVYGKRWEREVTVPVVKGPITPEGSPWPCAVKLRLLPSFFDDGAEGGGDALSIIDAQIRAQFPRSIVVAGRMLLRFSSVRSSKLEITLVDGKVLVGGTVVLDDDETKPTEFGIHASILLEQAGDNLAVKLGNLDLDWKGKTRETLLVSLADILTDVEKIAEKEVKKELEKVLPFIRLPSEPLRLQDLGLGDARNKLQGHMQLRVCSPPHIDREGVVLEVGATVDLTGKRKDETIAGPSQVRGRPAPLSFAPAGGSAHNVEAVASADALQQALYMLWQNRSFDAWGEDEAILEAFRAKMEGRLTLHLDKLDLRIPPAFVTGVDACPGFTVRFGDVAIGKLDDGRGAIAHADVCSSPRVRKGRLELEGRLVYVAANCEKWDGGLVLSPCLSDVIPVLRDEALEKYTLPISLPIPENLLTVSLVQGASVKLEDVEADTRAGALRVRARAVLSGSL